MHVHHDSGGPILQYHIRPFGQLHQRLWLMTKAQGANANPAALFVPVPDPLIHRR